MKYRGFKVDGEVISTKERTLGEIIVNLYSKLEDYKGVDSRIHDVCVDVYFETGHKIRLNSYDIYNIIHNMRGIMGWRKFLQKRYVYNSVLADDYADKYIDERIRLRYGIE